MTGNDVLIWLGMFSLPVCLLILGGLLSNNPPREINCHWGHRTRTSMQSQEAWDLAQQLSGHNMVSFGVAAALFTVAMAVAREFAGLSIEMTLGVALTVNSILGVASAVLTEQQLKRRLKEREK